MKLFPFPPTLWSSFLVLWISRWETGKSNLCKEDHDEGELLWKDSLSDEYSVIDKINETFSCHHHPSDVLNCSWSFLTLEEDAQLSVLISLCDEENELYSWSNSSKEGLWSQPFPENLPQFVIIQFNISLPEGWRVYVYKYDSDMLEVLPPPGNLSASVKDGNLLVTWRLPRGRRALPPSCFDYQLDLGEQEVVKPFNESLLYKRPHDPTRAYRVRMRARIEDSCMGSPEWSEWSDPVVLEPSPNKLNVLVILSISLGIPMILLAVLLLVRHPRVSQLLFPPIPHPPKKFIHFLEKNDAPGFFYPAVASKEEEITEVEDSEENIGTRL